MIWYKCTHVTEPSPKTKKDGHGDNNCKEYDDYITARTGTSGTTDTKGVGCRRVRQRGRRHQDQDENMDTTASFSVFGKTGKLE